MVDIALAGNPNTGKTTLFNLLTGSRARVGNYPGVTVERRSGVRQVGDQTWHLHDLPGCYSLLALSPEEEIATLALTGGWEQPRPACVIVVLDASSLARGLALLLQIRSLQLPCVAALNLMDQAAAQGLTLDVPALQRALGVPLVPMVAARGEGVAALEQAVTATLAASGPQPPLQPPLAWPPALAQGLAAVRTIPALASRCGSEGEAWFWLASEPVVTERLVPGVDAAIAAATGAGTDRRAALRVDAAAARFAWIDMLLEQAIRRGPARPSGSEAIDRWALHPIAGPALFLLVMAALFQAVFAGVGPAVDAIDAVMAALGDIVGAALPAGLFHDVVVDGVLAGVGATLVFVPQIAVLFLGLALLEDSGYLARAALLTDRLLGRAGLPGTAFVPLLSSFACNVPGILAARTLASPADRLVTILLAPLMSCAARLPVYALVTAAVFADTPKVWGVLAPGGLWILAMYALGLALALALGALLRRTVARGARSPLLLELPPYRTPQARDVALVVWRKVRQFCVETGSLIVALTVILWALMTFPRATPPAAELDRWRQQAAAAAVASDPGAGAAEDARATGVAAAVAHRADAYALEHSAAGAIGKAVEPLIAPLGFDWRIGIGLVGSFAAREVLIPVLGRVYGRGEEEADDEAYQGEVGASLVRVSGMTPLVGVALMIFFAVAMQCMSTVAVIRRETGTWRWALGALVMFNALAWVLAWGARQLGLALGWS